MSFIADLDETDLGAPMAMPARSVLFSLQPQGVGAAHQESLLSLLVRTSHAHAVSPRLLIRDVFAQIDPSIARLSTAAFFQRLAGTVNGLGKYAEMFVSAAVELTGQPNLRHLTMLPWRDIFPHNGQGLLARHPRWCPVCLHDQKRKGEITVFPLVWSMETYQTCLAHQVPLEHRCPSCGWAQRFFPQYPDLAVCGHCRRPLGRTRTSEAPSHFQAWVAEAVAAMVARQSTSRFTPSLERFRKFVHECVAAHTGGNRTAFCRALGFNEFGVSGWLNKNERPSITQFLALCYGTETMPTDIFNVSRPPTPTVRLRSPLEKLKDRAVRPRPGPDRRMTMKQALEGYWKSVDSRSVSSIAKDLGLSISCLRYWFPDLCKLLSDQHRAAAMKRSEGRQTQQCALVEKVVGSLKSEGNIPSKRKVDRLLRVEGLSLSQPHLTEAYQKAVR